MAIDPETSGGDRDPGDYLRSTVRLFPDYADSVIWFAPGPVPYELTKLSPDLIVAMIAWEKSFYAGLVDYFHWRSPELELAFQLEGLRIARLLSTELGDSFDVEVEEPSVKNSKLTLRGDGPGTNPDAIAVFQEWAADDLACDVHFRQLREEGHVFGWTAKRPTPPR